MKQLVLLVDDEDGVRRIAALTLVRLGFDVVEAADGSSALGILEQQDRPIDLIVSDVRMPGLQGNELAAIVAQRWPHVPVLLVSGHARAEDFANGDGGCSVLPKPYTRAQLAEAIEHCLAGATHQAATGFRPGL